MMSNGNIRNSFWKYIFNVTSITMDHQRGYRTPAKVLKIAHKNARFGGPINSRIRKISQDDIKDQ